MVNLKETHKLQLKAFFLRGEKNDITQKINALYKLIQSKGETITLKKMGEVKVLEITEGFYGYLKPLGNGKVQKFCIQRL